MQDRHGCRLLGLLSGEKSLLQLRQCELTVQVSSTSFQRFQLHMYEAVKSDHDDISFTIYLLVYHRR